MGNRIAVQIDYNALHLLRSRLKTHADNLPGGIFFEPFQNACGGFVLRKAGRIAGLTGDLNCFDLLVRIRQLFGRKADRRAAPERRRRIDMEAVLHIEVLRLLNVRRTGNR